VTLDMVESEPCKGLQLHWVELRETAPFEEAWLSRQERERASRFADGSLRRRYVASHVALRRLLGQRLDLAPGEVTIELTEGAKPRLASAQARGLCFSLARSADIAVIALSDGLETGVDVEHGHPLFVSDDFRELALTARERAALDRMPPALRAPAARRWWVRKEAVLKALGTGLRVPPSSIDVADPFPVTSPGAIEGLGVRWLDVQTPIADAAAALAWRVR
jgi:4'-phosphopantetheinyl transferase